jgi:hypothetical protein
MPEIAKSTGTPKRFQQVSPFAFFEVGFIGWIVRVAFALTLTCRLMGVLLAWYSQTLFGRPSSSQVSPKKDQFRVPRRSKYFGLNQREVLFGCLRRAHRHRLEKMMRSTRPNVRLLTTCR